MRQMPPSGLAADTIAAGKYRRRDRTSYSPKVAEAPEIVGKVDGKKACTKITLESPQARPMTLGARGHCSARENRIEQNPILSQLTAPHPPCAGRESPPWDILVVRNETHRRSGCFCGCRPLDAAGEGKLSHCRKRSGINGRTARVTWGKASRRHPATEKKAEGNLLRRAPARPQELRSVRRRKRGPAHHGYGNQLHAGRRHRGKPLRS